MVDGRRISERAQTAKTGRAGQTRRQVIDQAIREDRVAEIVLFVLAAAVVLTGVAVLIYGVASRQPAPALAGAMSSCLLAPAMMYAKAIRRENVAMRMLEIALDRADTAKEAAEAIREVFLTINIRQPKLNLDRKKEV